MDAQSGETKALVNARFSVRVRGIPPDKATDAMEAIKALFSEWGEIEVNVNISTPRKPLTLGDFSGGVAGTGS